VENDQGIRAESDHLSPVARAPVVREQTKTIRQTPAFSPACSKAISKAESQRAECSSESPNVLPLSSCRTGVRWARWKRRISLKDFQCGDQANTRGRDLAELMKQFGAAGELPGSDEQ
jgi:hypothetical protein